MPIIMHRVYILVEPTAMTITINPCDSHRQQQPSLMHYTHLDTMSTSRTTRRKTNQPSLTGRVLASVTMPHTYLQYHYILMFCTFYHRQCHFLFPVSFCAYLPPTSITTCYKLFSTYIRHHVSNGGPSTYSGYKELG